VHASSFDEDEFYGAVAGSGARALLIGRKALIALGVPVVTGDYDFWIHIDDIAKFNDALEPLGFVPNYSPDDARKRGRYVLENDERVDVLVARVQPTVTGERVAFDDVFENCDLLEFSPGVRIALPTIPDLIATKRFGARPKDAEDIRQLEALLAKRKS
jgi:predicted nucleotidyltransferase